MLQEQTAEQAKSGGCARQDRRALLVEDDADMRRIFEWMLRNEGYEVTEAAGGVELLDWIHRIAFPPWTTLFDLIVSDINMPDLTAIEVLGAMRTTVSTTPVILVTAFGDAETRRKARELGVCAVLDKPLHRHELRAALRTASLARADARVGGVLHA
jgi:DNA-binding response OmpR family regulator